MEIDFTSISLRALASVCHTRVPSEPSVNHLAKHSIRQFEGSPLLADSIAFSVE